MLTLLLILLPFVSGLIIYFLPERSAKAFSLVSTLGSLAVAVFAYTQFDVNGGTQWVIDVSWIELLGIRFHIGIDGISLVMILLSNLVSPLIILSSFKDNYTNAKIFYSFLLIMQGAMNGVFVSLDMFLYYIFWELALIPAYFLVLWWGRGEARKITFKFFIYTLFGSLFMLVAIIWLSTQSAAPSSDIATIYRLNIPENTQLYIFLAFMLAYAIKIPVFPFHTWQPDTYTYSPSPATMLLSAVMLKMGLYSIIRWIIPVVPNAVDDYGIYIITIAAIGVFYASAIAWVQKDLKKLFAYSSIAHVGLITGGILTVSSMGLQGAMVQMMAHAINVVGLFYICQILFRKFHNHEINNMGGLRLNAPLFAGLYLVVLLASVALPLTNAFPGEFMLLNSIYNINGWICLIAGSGVILGAVYMLVSYQKIMLGELNTRTNAFAEIDGKDKLVLIPIVVLIFVFGLFPHLITDISENAINVIVEQYQSKINGIIN
ncbi:MAG: NuoM family protein [Chitinophagales bacterium]